MTQTETTQEIIDRVVNDAAEEMRKAIDEGVLLDLLVECGWTKIPYLYYDTKKAMDMFEYCEQKFKKDQWKVLNSHFAFRNKKDAEWFILRWL